MSSVCDICGKGPVRGNSVARLGRNAIKRHVKSRTKRWFKPNIQRVRVTVNGTTKRVNACAACIKAGRVRGA